MGYTIDFVEAKARQQASAIGERMWNTIEAGEPVGLVLAASVSIVINALTCVPEELRAEAYQYVFDSLDDWKKEHDKGGNNEPGRN